MKSSRLFNPPQKLLKFGISVLSKVLNNYTKLYFFLTSTSWDIGQLKLLIKSHFLMLCLATSLVILEMEYIWTHKSWWTENLHSDRFWHGESANHTAGQQSTNTNLQPLTTHIYHVMIILTSGLSKKSFFIIIIS